MSVYFAIVNQNDCPIYELEWTPVSNSSTTFSAGGMTGSKDEHKHLNQFIIHSSLDIVDDLMWSNNSTYLKAVDRFNEWIVSAYVLPSGVRFMLLHDSKNEDGIKSFFVDCHELYIKTLLNPFYHPTIPITSPVFDSRVRNSAKKNL